MDDVPTPRQIIAGDPAAYNIRDDEVEGRPAPGFPTAHRKDRSTRSHRLPDAGFMSGQSAGKPRFSASRHGHGPGAPGIAGTPAGAVDTAVFPADPRMRLGATGPQALGGPAAIPRIAAGGTGWVIAGGGAAASGGSAACGRGGGAGGSTGGVGCDGTQGLAAGGFFSGNGSLGGTMAVPAIARESAGN